MVDGKVYISIDKGQEVYDATKNIWSIMDDSDPMQPEPVKSLSTIIRLADESFLAVGGFNRFTHLVSNIGRIITIYEFGNIFLSCQSTVKKYNETSRQWTALEGRMEVGKVGVTAVPVDKSVFLACADSDEGDQAAFRRGQDRLAEYYLMTVGGYHPLTDEVELMALDPKGRNMIPDCMKKMKPFPSRVAGAVGAALTSGIAFRLIKKNIFHYASSSDGLPIVCGGQLGNTYADISDACFRYNPERDDWVKTTGKRVRSKNSQRAPATLS